MIVETN